MRTWPSLWQIVHLAAGGSWLTLVAMILFEIVTTGNLSRQANSGGVYTTGDALFLLTAFGLGAVSAIRATYVEFSA